RRGRGGEASCRRGAGVGEQTGGRRESREGARCSDGRSRAVPVQHLALAGGRPAAYRGGAAVAARRARRTPGGDSRGDPERRLEAGGGAAAQGAAGIRRRNSV